MSTKSVFLLLLITMASTTSDFKPVIETTNGSIQGVRISALQKDVVAYLGIPYAKPPIGDLRFKKPVPVQRWNGTYSATEKPPSCMQHGRTGSEGAFYKPESENCLYLNVWVPQPVEPESTNTTLKPIMVWIHGGGFRSGSISRDLYDGAVLAAYGDIVVASMNYRLGPFGFMAINSDEAPGNMGMLDQVLALQWVRDNAENFGGDSNSITLFGESAGSISVALHLLSPLSAGLFTRAIMQSGGPIFPRIDSEPRMELSPEEGIEVTSKFVKAAGCIGTNQSIMAHHDEVMDCLRSRDARELIDVFLHTPELLFFPQYGDEFLPLRPFDALAADSFNTADVLAGVTSREASAAIYYAIPELRNSSSLPQFGKDEGKSYIVKLFNGSASPAPRAVADFYLDAVEEDNHETLVYEVINSLSDAHIVCPTLFFLDALVKSNITAYLYHFNHHPSNSPYPSWMAMAHFDDVQFVFGVPLRMIATYTVEEQELSRSVMDMWIGFARTGQPKVPENESWPSYTLLDRSYLEISTRHYKTGKDLRLESCNFWRQYVK